jgi:hypothetical protein
MIRHPANVILWWNIDSWNPEFTIDLRNIRITMNSDDMNPFMNNNTHSTWAIILTILNLPPSFLVVQQTETYCVITFDIGATTTWKWHGHLFWPLVEDLKMLWYNNGVEVWYEHKREYFQLKDILFVTVSDSTTSCILSGQNKKVGCGCPHCFREIDSQYLRESEKIEYMGHRRYITMKHQFWNMKDQLNGKTEKRRPPPHRIGHEVYEMVKDVYVVFGKRKRSNKNIEEDDMWKQQSIFWELPY